MTNQNLREYIDEHADDQMIDMAIVAKHFMFHIQLL